VNIETLDAIGNRGLHAIEEDKDATEDEPQEINFGDEALIVHNNVARALEREGEVRSGDESSKVENGIRKAIRGRLREFHAEPDIVGTLQHGIACQDSLRE
jgi:hypothetical protein